MTDAVTDAVQPRREGEDHPLDRLAATVRAVPGVAELYGGAMGEIGTHLPGRRIAGLRTRGERTEITVAAEFGRDLHNLATAVRTAAAAHTTGEVDVTIGDIVFPQQPHASED
ncbi:MAG: hypothetical protein ABR500_02695 [Dermatophilaceae bacterium]